MLLCRISTTEYAETGLPGGWVQNLAAQAGQRRAAQRRIRRWDVSIIRLLRNFDGRALIDFTGWNVSSILPLQKAGPPGRLTKKRRLLPHRGKLKDLRATRVPVQFSVLRKRRKKRKGWESLGGRLIGKASLYVKSIFRHFLPHWISLYEIQAKKGGFGGRGVIYGFGKEGRPKHNKIKRTQKRAPRVSGASRASQLSG